MSLDTALKGSLVATVPAMVGILVDKSGSMDPYTNAVTKSVNQLVLDQQKLKGSGQMTLAEFSHDYSVVFNKEFSKIDPKFHYNYQADGGTCLYNSIERMTADIENQLKGMAKKPKKVVVAIMTDGEDTHCGTTVETIKQLIEKKMKEGWEYMLLGALPDALNIADKMGIPKDRAAVVDSNNIAGSINFISKKISESRKGKQLRISDVERATLALPPSGKNEL